MEKPLERVCIPSHRIAPSSLTGLKRLSQKPDGRFFTPETPYTSSFPHAAASSFPHAFSGNPVSFSALKTRSSLAFSVKHERRWVPAKSAQE
ncbi:hypothetical protein [Undibacterium sp. CCC3.4]|uniref:hypothetical protein n=1 Tax=Undibacterium sp. CCC3.4 TaxID=3048609 RepID=UPI002AC99DE9|nr:hypothetical protein [Undibacterium sp. CCC3.4]WPX42038.1 hypothetical protein RHM61_11525 [Undibacterium sp. CCC3.4]